MALSTLLPIRIDRPGFTNTEILRDAPKIVAYAVKKKWCSQPQPMTPTKSNRRDWMKDAQV